MRGFSLAEMVIAAAVLLFVLVGVTKLATATYGSAASAIMNEEAPRWAQTIVEEQVAQGYCANADIANTWLGNNAYSVDAGSYVPGLGRQMTASYAVTDPVAGPAPLAGTDALLITATVTYDDPIKWGSDGGVAAPLVDTYVHAEYMSPPPSNANPPPPPCN
jgi:Tfp pilus assembly protein PilW